MQRYSLHWPFETTFFTDMADNDSTVNIAQTCWITPAFDETLHTSSIPKSVNPTRITFAVINGFAAPPTFVINLLIIWTVLRTRNLRSNSYNGLLVCLASTDILVSLIAEPFLIWRLGCVLLNCRIPCLFTIVFFATVICIKLTLSSLVVVSVERYLAIKHAVFHRTQVTTKRMIIAILITWVISPAVLLGSRHAMTSVDSLTNVPALVIVVVEVTVIAYCTIKVQITAYRRRKAFRARVAANINSNDQTQEDEKSRLQEYKHALTTSMLVLATFVCYCPFISVAMIKTAQGKDVTPDFKYLSDTIGVTFVNLQSLVNPLIVSLRIAAIRNNVNKKLCCKRRINENIPVHIELQNISPPAHQQEQKIEQK